MLRVNSWLQTRDNLGGGGSENHMCCQEWNPDQQLARQVPYPLHCGPSPGLGSYTEYITLPKAVTLIFRSLLVSNFHDFSQMSQCFKPFRLKTNNRRFTSQSRFNKQSPLRKPSQHTCRRVYLHVTARAVPRNPGKACVGTLIPSDVSGRR